MSSWTCPLASFKIVQPAIAAKCCMCRCHDLAIVPLARGEMRSSVGVVEGVRVVFLERSLAFRAGGNVRAHRMA